VTGVSVDVPKFGRKKFRKVRIRECLTLSDGLTDRGKFTWSTVRCNWKRAAL
jgi:hypothetical protein